MKAVIIEDESLIAEEMMDTIHAVAPDIEIVAILPSIKTATKWLENDPGPDLMFMDIKISDGLSFELFDKVQITCPVIFCTAYEEYAIRAFKANGVDYLLKPLQEDELKHAVDKVRRMKRNDAGLSPDIQALIAHFTQAGSHKPRYKERFILNSHNRWTPVETKDIAVIYRETINYIIRFNGDKLIFDYTPMDDLEEVLDPDMFFRANRQTILNINAVQSAKPYGNQKLLVQLKPPLKMEVDVSRERSGPLKKWLDR
ncbi:MAG TPA: LytTR family DNA-binding domain-containing protein [Phnomibacter sp.]|nr:LytTR family DNA-binding domain-containing protein [Phnomibacter sp.]